MATVHAFNNQAATVNKAIEDVKKNVQAFVGKTHPAALVAWFLVGAILIAGVIFTGWHNWSLFARGADTDFGKLLAAIPPLMLDGSIVILLTLLLTYFRDPLQWWVAVGFNVMLFVIVGLNTSLNYSLNSGETINAGMKIYLRWGILGSFLFAFALWEIIIHLDPHHTRRMARAKLEMQAEQDAGEIELEMIELQIQQQKDELAYRKTLAQKMHAARMKATESKDVEAALIDYEKGNAVLDAKEIRGVLPKA